MVTIENRKYNKTDDSTEHTKVKSKENSRENITEYNRDNSTLHGELTVHSTVKVWVHTCVETTV